MKNEVISSPIRWAGSKKKVLNEMLELFVKEKKYYVEPFLGSGVVLLNVINNNDILKYEEFHVNDINSNIISFYKLLQKNNKFLINELGDLSKKYNNLNIDEKEKMYYEIREIFNTTNNDFKPVYFYFLMKVGFNGVYRENKKGKFNVPFGKKDKFDIQKEHLYRLSKMIKKVNFYCLDYKDFLDKLEKKGIIKESLIYCDPPYIPEDDAVTKKQELYTKNSFNHNEFSNKLNYLNNTNVIVSMSNSKMARKIYSQKFYTKELVKIIRTINPKKLFHSQELLFSNYELKDIAKKK